MKKIIRNIAFTLLVFLAFEGYAVVSIDNFTEMQGDLSARTRPQRDLNGNLCAMVRVQIPIQGCSFEGNVLHSEYDVNEYHVYLSQGSKDLRIKIPDLESIYVRFGDISPIAAVESGVTYEMSFNGLPAAGSAQADAGGNFLIINITPADARVFVKIDGATRSVDGGMVSGFFPYGNHEYVIEAEGYDPVSGVVQVKKGDRTDLNITLTSNLANLSIKTDTPGVDIFLNESGKGKDSWTGQLPAGTYLIEGRMDGYRPYKESVTLNLKDRRTVTIPALQPVYGAMSVDCTPINSQITIDGQDYGTAPRVINNLLAGRHNVKITKSGYEPYETTIRIDEGQTTLLSAVLKKEPQDALTQLIRKAEAGDPKAQVSLGYKYEKGKEVVQNYSEAVKWYRMAAEQGNAEAQFYLGYSYHMGNGVPKDYREAAKWYRKAADQGLARAQVNLGALYRDGNGVTRDYNEAVKLFRQAADQGKAYGQDNLGYMYEMGYGVAKDLQQAIYWYKKAAAQGSDYSKKALSRLGVSY